MFKTKLFIATIAAAAAVLVVSASPQPATAATAATAPGPNSTPTGFTCADCKCQCIHKIFESKGQTHGNCKSTDETGQSWCYVGKDPVSAGSCPDSQSSQTFPGYHYSYHACDTLGMQSDQCKDCSSYSTNLSCPAGWTLGSSSSHCYYKEETEMTATAAESNCVSKGGHLASIHSQEENAFILGLQSPDDGLVWIGLTDSAVEGSFVWTDGTTVKFSKWQNEHPDEGTDSTGIDYVVMGSSTGKWYDLYSIIERKSICKKPVTVAADAT